MLVNSMTEERQEEKKDVTELNNYPQQIRTKPGLGR